VWFLAAGVLATAVAGCRASAGVCMLPTVGSQGVHGKRAVHV
jgi:hypothetical protein